jgi:hypothetical protein
LVRGSTRATEKNKSKVAAEQHLARIGIRYPKWARARLINLVEMDRAGEINQIWDKWLGPNTVFKMVREDKVVLLTELKFTPLP